MRIISPVLALTIWTSLWLLESTPVAMAQNAPLVSDPGQDRFEFCKHLYRQANNMQDPTRRTDAYRSVIPRLRAYIEQFPNHANAQAAIYYLGECYYHSGSIEDAK